MVAAGLFLAFYLAVAMIFPPGLEINSPPTDWKIIPAPSSTPTGSSLITGPSDVPTNPVEINGIKTGVYVQVNGTGGSGLRLRTSPGAAGTTQSIASDGEVFSVADGPKSVDGATWWKLEAPYQSSRSGWASGDFLSPIVTPTPSSP